MLCQSVVVMCCQRRKQPPDITLLRDHFQRTLRLSSEEGQYGLTLLKALAP
jgi:hypothetical protein